MKNNIHYIKTYTYPENVFRAIFRTDDNTDGYQYTDEIGSRLIEIIETTNALSNRKRAVIKARFKDKITLKECATNFSVTSEGIRHSESSALRCLRHPSRSKFILTGKHIIVRKAEDDFPIDELWMVDGKYLNCDLVGGIKGGSLRIHNSLLRAGIKSIDEFLKLPNDEICKIKGIGKASIRSLIKLFELHNINTDRLKEIMEVK